MKKDFDFDDIGNGPLTLPPTDSSRMCNER